ncbi:hypothetical protein MM300_06080 [Evansella sp. LMS18]|uniref:hypothetical protein n=1 Tax=Evansella sp. LMS18 TaxID=2924033 RepID=UPI0020D094F0|nr:hypothetical protein [Evansella sp. LMS18]UTR11864.1 hypothetical protein MM300_06080 [Evansella sp. LMS18]
MLQVLFITGVLLITLLLNIKNLKKDKKEKWLFFFTCLITAMSSLCLIYDQFLFRYIDLLENTFGYMTERLIGK